MNNENWIDINESLPKDGTRVLITCVDSTSPITASFIGGIFEIDLIIFKGSVVTHWMKLPKAANE